MKDAKRAEVIRFLREQGYEIKSETGGHTQWARAGNRTISLPRHLKVSAGVLRQIEKIIGFVPKEWK